MQRRTTSLLLPPTVCAALDARIDETGILPPNMVSSIVARVHADPAARERLHVSAQDLLEHLLSNQPGWGNWLSDVGEAVYIGIMLKLWLREAIAAEKTNLTKQELDKLEEFVLARFVERKEQS
jgi:hypothetical protein